jgi:DNA ligase-1
VSKRNNIMLAIPYDAEKLERWPRPILAQPKLDGFRCRAEVDSLGAVRLFTSEGNLISTVPHIVNALTHYPGVKFDGELYRHGLKWEAISSYVKRGEVKVGCEEIEYHIFDLLEEGLDQQARMSKLLSLSLTSPHLKVVDTYPCMTMEEVDHLLGKFTSLGYEGIIMRNRYGKYECKRSNALMKLKPRKTDYYRIVGSSEEIDIYGVPKGSLGSLQVVGQNGEHFSVGSGNLLTRDGRDSLWKHRELLPGKWARIKYQCLTEREVPRHPVVCEIVSEQEVPTHEKEALT